MTRQRALILRLIRESGEHPTAEEIYRKAKEEMPGIALATVYNNLNHLAQEGEIRKISCFMTGSSLSIIVFHDLQALDPAGKNPALRFSASGGRFPVRLPAVPAGIIPSGSSRQGFPADPV